MSCGVAVRIDITRTKGGGSRRDFRVPHRKLLRLMGINCLAYLALRIYNSYNSATTRSNNLKVIADQSQLLVLYVVIIRNFYRILRLLCLELLFFALNN